MPELLIPKQQIRATLVRFLATLLAIVFVTEAGIMLVLPVMLSTHASRAFRAGVDASLLVVILAPTLWWMIIRPLQRSATSDEQQATRLVAILKATPDLVSIADPEGWLIYLNPAGRTMLGIDELADLTKVNLQQFHDAANSHIVMMEAIPTAVRDGAWTGETVLTSLGGQAIPISQVVLAHKTAYGKLAFLSTIARDISERNRTRDALRTSERLLARAQRIAHLGSWTLDLKTNAVTWSDELYRIYGVSPDGFIPTVDTFLSQIHVGDRAAMMSWTDSMLSGTKRSPMEFRVIRPDGTIRLIERDGEFEVDAENKPIRLIGTAQDITARKAADRSLRESEDKFRTLFETAQDGVFVMNAHGFLECNGYAERLFGCRKADLIGHSPVEFSPFAQPDGRLSSESAAEHVHAAMAGSPQRFAWQHARLDGAVFDADVTLNRMDISGEPFLQAIVRDVSEHLKLEAQYRQAQKMESVGQLASGIAHDFNNLLTVINGMAELVLTRVGQDDPVRADVQEIASAGKRAAGLTHQLLAFSRQQILAPRVLDLNTVVANLEGLLRRLLGEDIDLVVVPTPGTAHVKADVGQLEQVISNLAVNAHDAMPQGGRLTIETQTVTIDETQACAHGEAVVAGPYVRLTVTDAGTGMDKATRARIFEPFFTTKGPGKGTGLGLATVWGIVTQSQGFVSVDSEVGRGTSVQVFLPQVAEAATLGAAAPTLLAPRSGTETILLAEDNAGLRKLATRILNAAGYTVLGVATGQEALRVLEELDKPVHLLISPVHLLLTDVVMPGGMSGRQLAEQVAQTHSGVKVLYMSGYTSDTVVRHGVLDAIMPFLNKPFTAVSLLGKVRDVLDS